MPKNATRILLVDDSEVTLDVLERNLSSLGYSVAKALSAREAVERLAESPFDLIITDLRMPGMTGLDLVRHVRETLPNTAVMMITGYATIEGAVEAVKTGAEEYLAKPFTDEELRRAVERVLTKLAAHRAARAPTAAQFGLVGESPAFGRALASLRQMAREKGPVLIQGEPGTGRRAAALAVLRMRKGAGSSVLTFDADRFAESAGAGVSEHLAAGGSLYLKGLDSAGPSAQAALFELVSAHALLEGALVLSSGPALPLLVERGLFRGDLYGALATRSVILPPLRERGDDVLALAEHFLADLASRLGKSPPAMGPAVVKVLRSYPWPGNVEELRAAVLEAYVRNPGEAIDVRDLPGVVSDRLSKDGPFKTLADSEARHIEEALALAGGRKGRAAELLGIDRKTLREKLKTMMPKSTKPEMPT